MTGAGAAASGPTSTSRRAVVLVSPRCVGPHERATVGDEEEGATDRLLAEDRADAEGLGPRAAGQDGSGDMLEGTGVEASRRGRRSRCRPDFPAHRHPPYRPPARSDRTSVNGEQQKAPVGAARLARICRRAVACAGRRRSWAGPSLRRCLGEWAESPARDRLRPPGIAVPRAYQRSLVVPSRGVPLSVGTKESPTSPTNHQDNAERCLLVEVDGGVRRACPGGGSRPCRR